MKKSYIKPLIDFESFELAEFVAACNAHNGGSFGDSCYFTANFYLVSGSCTVTEHENNWVFFNKTSNASCTYDPNVQYQGAPPEFFRS